MADIRKKILFITTQLPYPPVSGGVIKSWRMVQHLSKKNDLYAAFFLKDNDPENLKSFLDKVNLKGYYTENSDIPRNIKNLLLSLLMFIPLNLFRNRSHTFKKHIQSIVGNYDTLLIDHYEMFQYVPKNFKGRVVLHQHNCEYLMWQRFAEIEKNPLKKLALYLQSFLIKRYERQICKRAYAVLAAPNDIEELVKLGVDRDKFFITYHLADDSYLKLPPLNFPSAEDNLLFVGTLTWEANIDGLIWFLGNCWERLLKVKPSIHLSIVGKNPDKRIQDLAVRYSNISLPGFVEDLEPYFQKSKVFISPLRFGSGIKVKVVNALYRGIPVVTTPVGIEGLSVENGKHLFYSSNPEVYVNQIIELLDNHKKWEDMSVNSRKFAEEHLSWEFVLFTLDKSLNS